MPAPERDPSTLRPRPPRLRALACFALLGLAFFGLEPFLLPFRLDFGSFELGGDQRIVLGTEVDLLLVVSGLRPLGRLLVAHQVVLALELFDVAHAHVELMRDPGIGPALADPGANLVEVRPQRSAGHRRPERSAKRRGRVPLAPRGRAFYDFSLFAD